MDKKISIAVLVSGHIRTFQSTKHSWEHAFDTEKYDVDFFFHCWDNNMGFIQQNNIKNLAKENCVENSPISQAEISKMLSVMNPKILCIEPQLDSSERLEWTKKIEPFNSCPYEKVYANLQAFSGKQRVVDLFFNYMSENKKVYDFAAITRYDVVFESPIDFGVIKPKTICLSKFGSWNDFSDFFIAGEIDTIKTFSQIYDPKEIFRLVSEKHCPYNPHMVMKKHCAVNGLNVTTVPNWGIFVLRLDGEKHLGPNQK